MHLRDLAPAIRADGNRRLLAAWLRWRGEHMLPRRTEMRLSEIIDLLPTVGLLEVAGEDEVRMRVAGSGLRDLYGQEMTGRNIKEVTDPADWEGRKARYRALLGQPCGSFYVRRDTLPNGRIVTYETVSLPIDAEEAAGMRYMMFGVFAIEKIVAIEPPAGPRRVPVPDDFQFVDIGAGMPALREGRLQ